MAKIGVGGLVCGIIGTVMEIMMFILPSIAVSMILSGTMTLDTLLMFGYLFMIFMYGGLALGALGLILGIVGAAKDDVKAPGIVGIVFGAVALGIGLYFVLGVGAAMLELGML